MSGVHCTVVTYTIGCKSKKLSEYLSILCRNGRRHLMSSSGATPEVDEPINSIIYVTKSLRNIVVLCLQTQNNNKPFAEFCHGHLTHGTVTGRVWASMAD